jgi:hypothetical protein
MDRDPAGRADGRIERLLNRALVGWTHAVRVRARPVLVVTALVTAALTGLAAGRLGLTTHHTALLSEDLPFWKDYNEFAQVFPILDEALLVVVDAETPGRARDATDVLAARLAADSQFFDSVYVPGGGEFFERHALLYLSVEELEDLSDHLASVQPLLAELARDRSLRNLAHVLQQGLEYVQRDPGFAVNLTAVFDSLSLAAEAVLEGRPRPISWSELLLERSLPGESSRRLIVVQPRLEYDRLLPARRAMGRVREAAAALGFDREPGLQVRITGNVALNTEEMSTVARQAIAAAAGSFLLVGGVLFLALRSRNLVLSILLTLLVGLIWTAAFAALAVGQLNVVSSSTSSPSPSPCSSSASASTSAFTSPCATPSWCAAAMISREPWRRRLGAWAAPWCFVPSPPRSASTCSSPPTTGRWRSWD